MATLSNTKPITIQYITNYLQEDVHSYIKNYIFDDEYFSTFNSFCFCGEFQNKQEVIKWYLEKDPAFQNLPEKVFQLFNEEQIMNQIESEYMVIPVEGKKLYNSGAWIVFYVFEKESED